MNYKILCLSLFSISTLNVQSVQRLPNFVLINLDDCGYGDFSCYGATGYVTPYIDKMAAEGIRFTHFLAVQPVSGASRAGLMTGCYPNRIGMYGAPGPHDARGIHSDELTIGELLKQKGYRTAIFGKWHLGDAYEFLPLQNGFDEYYGLPYSNDMWPYHPEKVYPDLPTIEGNTIIGYNTNQSRLTTEYTERAIRFIRENKEVPFFLYMAHSMPHVPLAVSDKFKGRSSLGLYGDVVMELDWSVGEILRTLEDLHLDGNTLVILTSDNGPWIKYGNHAGSTGALREGKSVTFEGGNRVPCIMYWKGRIEPGICNQLASNIDIFPTFAELSGAPLPPHAIDGISLRPLIEHKKDAVLRTVFAYYYKKNDLEAITDGMYKLIFPHSYNSYECVYSGNDGNPGRIERVVIHKPLLYDLRRDPGERYDIYEQYPMVVERLEKEAESLRIELGDRLRKVEGKGTRKAGIVSDTRCLDVKVSHKSK